MIAIDGSKGEGGGQIVRTSLALSLLTGKAFRIFNVRAGRQKPGLKRQHLTAVDASAQIGNATVSGNEIGSGEISFEPGLVAAGNYRFQISTAGSITLVLQTVLPALMLAKEPSTLTLSGGTHNSMAPPFDFLERSFVPQLNKMGPKIELSLARHGFYPAGGGEFTASITPTEKMTGIDITERGKRISRRIRGIVSSLPVAVAARETARVVRKLNWDRCETEHIEVREPRGPGNVLLTEIEHENVTAVFSSFGQIGISAEKVADSIVRDIRSYLKSEAPVGPHLADQLMLPMAIAAHFHGAPSKFVTGPLTQHSLTQIEIIGMFLDANITTRALDERGVEVTIA